MEKLYNRKEAAAILGISIASLDNARYAGIISYIQYVPNGSVFFTEEAIQEFLAKSTHRALSNANRDTYRKRRNNPK